MRIPIVNEQDEVIEYKDRDDVMDGEIVRITAIWVTDGNDNILMAQRSFKKKHSPGLWGPGVAGTVEEGETYESNAYKELEEELGITGVKLKPIKKILYTSRTGSKFCYFYNLEVPIDTQFKIQENELEQVKWFSKEELKNLLNTKPEDFVHALELLKEFFLEIK
jgi:isopentenyldiphosphate isomerase